MDEDEERATSAGGCLQIADVIIYHEVSEDARKRIDLWTGWIAGALLEGEHARLLVQRAYTHITQGELVDTYARSTLEDTRHKALKFGDGLDDPGDQAPLSVQARSAHESLAFSWRARGRRAQWQQRQ